MCVQLRLYSVDLVFMINFIMITHAKAKVEASHNQRLRIGTRLEMAHQNSSLYVSLRGRCVTVTSQEAAITKSPGGRS